MNLASSSLNPCRMIKRRSRQGITLIEVMIAVALTLVIVAAMIRAFAVTGDSISEGRARMDMHNKIRVVVEKLRRDLQNTTRIPNPRSTSDGYLTIIEGEETDAEHATDAISFIGDHDDYLLLTVRSEDEPFRGRFVDASGAVLTVESYLAEVIWWVEQTGSDGFDGQFRLHRRELLIRPDLATGVLAADIDTFFQNNDISVRVDGTGLSMNSLSDLTLRQNRFAHDPALFPHELDPSVVSDRILGGSVEGFDVMLDDCVAFDIKVFDPTAEAFDPDPTLAATNPLVVTQQVIEYDDPGFEDPNTTADLVGTFDPSVAANASSYGQVGSYVNLGYDAASRGGIRPIFNNDRWFAGDPFTNNYTWNNYTYCTWWNGYESDGIDQDTDGLFDEGVDGVDNDATSGIDDNDERETAPPYAYPVRAIEVRIRMIERNTAQVLQQSVRESFVMN